MPVRVACLNCRDTWVEHDELVCPGCLRGAVDPRALLQRVREDHQQYRVVLSSRFTDTKAFLNQMRAAARTAGCRPVEGPAAVRIVGQRSAYRGTWLTAYRMVEGNLAGVLFGEATEVRSVSVTLIDGGYAMTVVEVRGMLEDELAGVAGVAR